MSKVVKGIIIAVIVLVLALAITMTVIWSGMLSSRLDDSDTQFRVLQITDVHIRNDKRDNMGFDTITKMINKSNPNLIVVTGDVSSNQDNEADFRKFGAFMESFKIEWTFTFGNHDAEGNWSKAQISEYLQSLEYCSYRDGYVVQEQENDIITEGSYGNYYQLVEDSEGNVIQALFFLDSNMYIKDEANGYDGYANFREEQVAWYESAVKEIALAVNGDESKVVPSVAYFHIPMQEYLVGYKEGDKLNGGKMEDVFCSPKADEMFETMKALGSTKATFVGHDHVNSYSVEYQGIKLCYGYSADHTLYFVPERGGTLVNIMADGSFTIQGLYRYFGVGALVVGRTF